MKKCIALSILLMVYLTQTSLFAQTDQNGPNIILIMVNDLDYWDFACYGQQMIRTPNIDTMASQGIIVTDYFSGSTVCAPSREAFLTGIYTGHTFIRGKFLTNEREDPALPADKKTIEVSS